MPQSNTDFQIELLRRLDDLQRQIDLLATKPLFDIRNLSTSISITADQNNLALDDYDMIFLTPDAPRTIHGITNGHAGRWLVIHNNSAFTLSITHQNAAADAENRIATATAGTIALPARNNAWLVYLDDATLVTGGTRWRLLLPVS